MMKFNKLEESDVLLATEDLPPVENLTPLKERTQALYQDYLDNTPDEIKRLKEIATNELIASEIGSTCLQEGDIIHAFSLYDANNKKVDVVDLLAQGPLVISFYRGSWCGFCNLELRSLQEALPYIRALGADLVAISPEQQDGSRDISETFQLGFNILSDVGNVVAKQFGLAYAMEPKLRPIYSDLFNIDIPGANGDKSWQLPVTATYIVAPDRKIILADTNPDHTKRLEPRDIIEKLRQWMEY